MVNFEGGADPEEYLTKYIGDRVTTTATVFLGVTLACAECHDHKYDPFTQKDFYRFYAFFNGIAEQGLDGNKESPAPRMKVPTAEPGRAAGRGPVRDRRGWASGSPRPRPRPTWPRPTGRRSAAIPRPTGRSWSRSRSGSTGGSTLAKQPDGSVLASGTNPDKDVYEVVAPARLANIRGFRLEALTHESLVGKGTGRADNANFVLTGFEVESATEAAPDAWSPVPIARAEADYFQADGDFRVAKAIDADPSSGWAVDGDTQARGSPGDLRDQGPVRLRRRDPGQGPPPVREPVRPPRHRPVPPGRHGRRAVRPCPSPVAAALAVEPSRRTEAQAKELRTYFRAEVWPEGRAIRKESEALKAAEAELEKSIPVTMVMAEMAKPRPTHVLMRGDFRSKGPVVEAGRPGEPAAAPARPAREPAGPGPMAGRPRPSAGRPGDGQPVLAAVFRHRDRQDGQRLRHPGGMAQPSRAARLAGHRVRRQRLGRQGDPEADRHLGRLPAGLEGRPGR